MAVHILGIRHHGPGSARNVKAFLEEVKPDIVLVEGPPDADGLLSWVSSKELVPPVAILCYQPDNPQESCFYPFAAFSPEWQAILYARKNNIHVRFMDLPIMHQFALDAAARVVAEQQSKEKETTHTADEAPNDATADEGIRDAVLLNSALPLKRATPLKLPWNAKSWSQRIWKDAAENATSDIDKSPAVRYDPIGYLAEAAGFADGEKWWEYMFEHRINNEDVFEAVYEAMRELRLHLPVTNDKRELMREAWMRKTIRQAEKEMFQNIAVICGAWHAPALRDMPKAKEDNDLLKGLPKVKTDCTWIPWTFDRLSYYSGYGAGIESPGWYAHVWEHPNDDGTRWMAAVAKLFREKQMDVSVAHVIEAVRLAGSLASLRGLPKVGLDELNEATRSILCNGEDILLQLVKHELIVSNRLGQVPEEIPRPPLQVDIEKQQKKLRLPAQADWKDYVLDLRKELDLDRSTFLHRLFLLKIRWGTKQAVAGKGTFKEQWRLQWDPSFSIDIIEKGNLGNTAEEAAAAFVKQEATKANSLPEVCQLLEETVPADLPAAVGQLLFQINNMAATGGDVLQLMEVIPGLVNLGRYGDVRKTDTRLILDIITGMLTRIYVSLPLACTGIDEEAANGLADLLMKLDAAVNLLQTDNIKTDWQQTLQTIAHNRNASPVLMGYATRLLTDYGILKDEPLVQLFYQAVSVAVAPSVAAAWLGGFLKGSGTILLLDDTLWKLVYQWVEQLDEENFTQVLPLLRRCFSEYTKPERRKLGEKVKTGGLSKPVLNKAALLDEERGAKGIAVLMKMLGVS